MLSRLKGRALAAAIGFCCGSGFLLLGYDQGVMGGVVGYSGNTFAETFDNPGPTVTGLLVSVYEIGCMFGAIVVIFGGEKIGRQRALVIGGIIVVIGTILQASSYSRAQFIVARIVTGLGNGINTSTLGIYQSETCSAESRGKLVTVEGIQAICGVMIAYWLDFGMSYTTTTAQWRVPVAFQAVFAIAMAGVASILPESPRWLISNGRDDEAKRVIAALGNVETDDESVKQLYHSIRETIEYENAVGSEFTYRDLFTGGDLQNFRRMCLCFGIQFMEEMGGVNMITYYLSVVFLNIGTSHFLALLLSGVNCTTFFLTAFVPIFLIDRVGRKPLLIYGSIGMTCTMVMLAGTLSHPGHASGIIAILSIFLFQAFYSTGGWMATPFLYPSEISTLRLRSKGSAISVLSKWIFNFLVVMISPVAIANIGWRIYIVWAVLNFTFIFIVYFFYPESKLKQAILLFTPDLEVCKLISALAKGLTLEETDKIFEGGDPITRGAIGFARKNVRGHPEPPAEGKSVELDTHVEKV